MLGSWEGPAVNTDPAVNAVPPNHTHRGLALND